MACWLRATQADPTVPTAFANLAAGLHKKGDVAGAVRVLEEGLAHSPRDVLLRMVAAQLYEAEKRPEEAKARLLQVVEIEPWNVDAWTSLGALRWQANELTAAAECFERALEIEPMNWQHAANLAKILARVPEGRQRARQVLQSALSYYPDEPELHTVLGALQDRP
jgi:tetratricopeptide (TPR) repeat protein